MLSVLLVIPNRQMSLAKAERSSQFDKINARRVCFLPLPSESLAGRKDREVFTTSS